MHNNNLKTGIVNHIYFKKFIQAIYLPFLIILIASSSYAVYRIYYVPMFGQDSSQTLVVAFIGLQTIIVLSIYWSFARLIDGFAHYLSTTSLLLKHKRFAILLPFFKSLIKTISLLAMVDLVAPYLGLPPSFEVFLEKFSSVLIICAITWLLLRLTHVSEQFVLNTYFARNEKNITSSKLFTQMLILKRIGIALILILALGSILMLFENVRTLGTSVLTTAGIVSLLLTLTAQRSLPSVLASVEIAMTQPIKIGDSVVVENQFGVVEKINFRFVVIKLWDWRRLILPTNYFLEKPFENWSVEQSENLIGTVILNVDYTLPVEALRKEFSRILHSSPLWDGNVHNIQVSNCSERTMELRILASAKNPTDTWNLRCEIREKLIAFISKDYPTSLPINRDFQLAADRNENFPVNRMKEETISV